MRALILGAATLAFMASPALASDRTDILATVHQYAHSFIIGDAKAGAALCTPDASVIDDFPPHAWRGTSACADWSSAAAAFFQQQGITGAKVSVGASGHLQIEGSAAYGVYPSVVSFKQKGKAVSQHGLWTFAMRKGPAGWRIAAWAWSDK